MEKICNVCGENIAKGVFASRIAPVSLAYCESCLSKGAEAYYVVVTTAAISKSENPDFQMEKGLAEILTATLEVTGCTIEQFHEDVEVELQKYLETKK
ncbi:hypothetical protein [Ureibacillus manganicus]|uniref:Uncharacterized protein n=1 Tax=Ureibacillus manganicus DSM 26584 TaxID=1384049 RepID=A0A0A3HLU9_9BACL|nr:hypothetical protein [Ureibacillus manganicus]KGR73556.1 hypothetical protein CD29_19650 [Ureibacillus manganicus DSM 26584]